VQFTVFSRGKRTDFAIGIEAGQDGVLPQDFANPLDFFLDPLLQDQFAADTADENGQLGRDRTGGLVAGPGRSHGAVDQTIEIGFHQAGVGTFRNVSGKSHALFLLVYGKDGTDHSRFPRPGAEAQGEQETGRRQADGMVAEVSLVEFQGRMAVHLKQDVPLRAGDEAFRTKRVPASERAIADLQLRAVKPQHGNRIPSGGTVPEREGFFKPVTVTGQPAGNRDPAWQVLLDAAHQVAAVHRESVREHEDVNQPERVQPPGQGFAGVKAVAHLREADLAAGYPGVLKVNGRSHQGIIGHLGPADLSGSGAAEEMGCGIGGFQRFDEGRIPEGASGAEEQDQLGGFSEAAGRLRTPSGGLGPSTLFDLHGSFPRTHWQCRHGERRAGWRLFRAAVRSRPPWRRRRKCLRCG